MRRRLLAIATAGVLTLAGAACASDDAGASVVAAFYPLQFLAERVTGGQLSVSGLAPPGVEAHDLELTPSQVADVAGAELVVYLDGFQPAVDAAVADHAGRAFDVAGAVPLLDAVSGGEPEHRLDEPEHAGADLHLWLDPERMATLAERLAAELAEVDPDHAADFTANAEALAADLAALDAEFAAGLAQCERREVVVSHAAFGYLTDRYDLHQVAVAGLSPEDEPTPRQLAAAIQRAQEHAATTIFFEVLVSPDVAEVIATEVGADTAVLDPIEGHAPGSHEDYLSLMRRNLDALRTGLGCA
jgi:zinc transport system substrate-binding protein